MLRGKKIWSCKLPLEPMGKQRPRVVRRGNFTKTFTPPKTLQWERDAARVLQAHWRRPPQEGPVHVVIRAYRKRTKYMEAKCRQEITTCSKKPDVDNIAKICLDSMVKARVLVDDNQVVQLVVSKEWAAYGQPGSVEFDLYLQVP